MSAASPDSALVIGEALIDVVERDGRTLGEHVGGSPLNVAVGLSRLGRDVDFLTHVGDDDRGRRIVDYVEQSAVRLVAGSTDADRTPTALARLDASGAATYEFDIVWETAGTPEVSPPLVVHTGSIAAFLAPGCLATAALLDAYRTSATVSYDPNVRPALIDDREQAIDRISRLVAKADLVKASDEDLHWIDPDRPAEEVARTWQELGPAVVVVTRGADGAFAVSDAGTVTIEAPPVEVVDTVGAGDAFMAGLVDALWSRDLLGRTRRDALAGIGEATLGEVLREAARVSAYVVARAGADLPRRADLRQD
ncbi:carbohydrate kinase family protein [Mycolicibacterium grossiae]|uniref:Carbohydrate kinase n=1 Tax=Mycolicibacterium grossiae TaxID=1552759 RepID=A0A1E8QC60_9MYCO|nr:carbohydrate kinase [Mycolicibacterium grossiae]OFJ55660.1 carbohydrate kinase [Mycolicibacterium grossiae]QEM43509.1 carbohydrate kinase [Mycolicibacterium grossiae]